MTIGLAITIGLLLISGAVLLLTAGAYLYYCGTQGATPLPRLLPRERIDITGGDETEKLLPRTRV